MIPHSSSRILSESDETFCERDRSIGELEPAAKLPEKQRAVIFLIGLRNTVTKTAIRCSRQAEKYSANRQRHVQVSRELLGSNPIKPGAVTRRICITAPPVIGIQQGLFTTDGGGVPRQKPISAVPLKAALAYHST